MALRDLVPVWTPADEKILVANGRADFAADRPPVVRLFHVSGMEWLISAVDPANPMDLWGLADLGTGQPEIGRLSFLDIARLGHTRLTRVQIDSAYTPGEAPLSRLLAARRKN